MKIIISPRAEKELKKLSKINQIALVKKIRSLAQPPIVNEEKLSGYKNVFRVRVGDFRIIYKKSSLEIFIILIGHRKEIYKLLKQLL
ncbi:MAG: type II toxin-antitoxin system RelE/ParE family toxin [Candidatus Omnitrophota bacterium]